MSLYLDHFGLREAPFRITPQLDFFYAGAQRGALLDALYFAVLNDEGIVLVTGEVGTGKTMLSRMLVDRLGAEVQIVYLANPSLDPDALLATLAHELGAGEVVPLSALRSIESRLIALHAEGRRVLLLIDEAHAMPRESLERVRLLANLESPTRKLLQIALFGQPELDALLATRDMRSFRERVTQRFELRALSLRDASEYLRFHLRAAGYKGPDPFAPAALRILHKASLGLTRRLNILADKALLAAYAEGGHSVGRREAGLAVRDADYPASMGRPAWRTWALAGVLACGVAAVPAALLALRDTIPASSATAPPAVAGTLPASASQPLVPVSEATEAKTPSIPSQAASSPETAHPPAARFALRDIIAASAPRITATPAERWFIQLLTAQAGEIAAVDAFLLRLQGAVDPAALMAYESTASGRPRIGVILGTYASEAEAARALAALPAWLRSSGAYVRSYRAFK